MPRERLPWFGKVNRNVDGVELSDRTYRLIDGYVDEEGFDRKRPGLRELKDLGAGVNQRVEGLFWWAEKGYVIAVAGGNIYKVTYSSGTATVTDLTGDTLSSNVPVRFATDGTYVFISANGQVVYTDGSASTAYLADADAPTTVTHVAWMDGYLIANDGGTNQFQWSDVNSSLAWTASSFASAAGSADLIVALAVHNREIFLFGEKTLEIWENDGISPFVRVPGGFREYGCVAPASITTLGDSIFWLDDERHIRGYSGGSSQIISTPFDSELADFSTVDDCVGFSMQFNGKQFLVFTFPAEARTLVYNVQLSDWSEWCFWDTDAGSYSRWKGQSYCHAIDWGVHLVGSRMDSMLFVMEDSAYDDAGSEIRMQRQTGFIDHGSLARKRTRELLFRVKRGAVDLATTPVVMLRWRDEGRDAWSNEHRVSLGDVGNREFVARLKMTGIYRARQYEITATDSAPILFGKAEEVFDVLR